MICARTLTCLAANSQQRYPAGSLDKTEKDVTALDSKLAEFQTIDPAVIISPFRSETKSLASIQPSIANYVSPAVLALLLQHLAVTFAALSIVRERNIGTIELFRVSPLSAAEALFGKYISYMLFGGVDCGHPVCPFSICAAHAHVGQLVVF